MFGLPDIIDLLNRAQEVLLSNDDCVKAYATKPPIMHEHFWISKYLFLEYYQAFYNHSFEPSADEQIVDIMRQIKTVLECMQPIKVALETISMEPRASASLIKPLADQLLDNHFKAINDDLVMEIRTIVQEEFNFRFVFICFFFFLMHSYF